MVCVICELRVNTAGIQEKLKEKEKNHSWIVCWVRDEQLPGKWSPLWSSGSQAPGWAGPVPASNLTILLSHSGSLWWSSSSRKGSQVSLDQTLCFSPATPVIPFWRPLRLCPCHALSLTPIWGTAIQVPILCSGPLCVSLPERGGMHLTFSVFSATENTPYRLTQLSPTLTL